MNEPRYLGKYELLQRLGRGGMAEVWKAFDPHLRRYVAIKFLHANLRAGSDALTRFSREAQAIASLRHPHIVQIHDFLSASQNDTSIPYMVMDYIEGQTLAEYLRQTARKGNFPTSAEIMHIFTALCLAVDYAHQHGIIHRDIKPANILLDRRNLSRSPLGEPILTDFGIVKLVGVGPATVPGAPVGTPLYLSPEQAQGRPGNESSDIYSLGIILYEICTGVTPFHGDGIYAILMQHVYDAPTRPSLINPQISPALEAVILRCVEKKPEARFPSATALAIALAQALQVPVPEELVQAHFPLDPGMQPTRVHLSQTGPLPDGVFVASAAAEAVPVTPMAHPRAAALTPHALASRDQRLPRQSLAPDEPKGIQYIAGASVVQLPPRPAPEVTRSPRFPARLNTRQRSGILAGLFLIAAIVIIVSRSLTILEPSHSAPASGVSGQATFLDSGRVNDPNNPIVNDEIQITLHNIPTPPAGESYDAWLLQDNDLVEAPAIYLGKLQIDHGNATLLGPPTGTAEGNLLKVAGSVLITREAANTQALVPPLDSKSRLYVASFPQKPGADNLSSLDHLRHLLAGEPDLESLGLRGGLDFRFRNAVEEIWKWSLESIDHPLISDKRAKVVNMLYYLHGLCAAQDLAGAPPDTHADTTDISGTKVPLLDCAQTPTPDKFGYIKHILYHIQGVVSEPGATTRQIQLASQIDTAITALTTHLEKILLDAQQLVVLDDAHFQDSPLLDDIVLQAREATEGSFDADTGTTLPGASTIYGMIQDLATLDLTAYTASQ